MKYPQGRSGDLRDIAKEILSIADAIDRGEMARESGSMCVELRRETIVTPMMNGTTLKTAGKARMFITSDIVLSCVEDGDHAN